MTFRLFHSLFFTQRCVIVALELLVILLVIAAGAVTYGLTILAHGPVDIGFAKNYIQDALSNPGQKVQVDVGRATLSWPNQTGPLQLDLERLVMTDNGRRVAEIRNATLAVAMAPLIIGRIRPERLILNAPLVTLARDENNHLMVDLGQNNSTPEATTTDPSFVLGAMRHVLLGDNAHDYGLLSRVNQVEVRRARVHVADQMLGMTWQVNDVNVLFRAVDVGVLGTLDVQLPGQQKFSTTLTYHREKDTLSLDSQFQDFPLPSFVGRLIGADFLRGQQVPLTGTVKVVAGIRTPRLDEVSIEAKAAAGVLNTADLLGARLPVHDVNINISYMGDADGWQLRNFDFVMDKIPVTSALEMRRDDKGAYNGELVMKVKDIDHDQIAALWPENLRDTPAAVWLVQKMRDYKFHDVNVTLPVMAQMKPRQFNFVALRPRVTFAYDHLLADYHAPLLPVEDASGTGTFEDDILTVNVADGHIQDLQALPSTVRIRDLTKAGAGLAELDIQLKGPLKTMLNYIAIQPISLGDQLPIKADTVKGTGTYHAVVSFPTLKELPKDQVEADVSATLDDIELPKLVKGQTLSGGPYALTVKDGVINLKGSGQLAGAPITLEWTEPVSKVAGKPAVAIADVRTTAALRKAFGADLPFIEGEAPVHVTYNDLKNGHETVDLNVDLTPPRVNFSMMKYQKAAGVKGSASLKLDIRNGQLNRATDLNVSAPGFRIPSGTLSFGLVGKELDLTNADLPDVTIGKNKTRIAYTRTTNLMKVDVSGAQFDVAPFLGTKTGSGGSSPAISFTADVGALGFGGTEDLKSAKLNIELDTMSDINRLSLVGSASGKPISMTYIPDAQGRMTLDVNAADAGAFLRVLDVYDNMVGGVLRLQATPIGNNNRDVKGNLVIKDFAVIKAPVLAQLLGAMSLQGFGEQLSNKGLGFERLESGFAMVRRAGQDLMSFREGRTTGSALGLTFDGIYDRGKGTIDLTGTVVPVSGLNNFASKIPLIGRFLAGGDDSALFAATYSIKGPVANPSTSINPLAVLTPGILRKLLFEDRPHLPPRDNDGSAKGQQYN